MRYSLFDPLIAIITVAVFAALTPAWFRPVIGDSLIQDAAFAGPAFELRREK
ncbi:MAG: hypothetical protein VXZ82_11365 [Planctomycetota bacterium]|nr:hypothetical protein [Planctomycetota bacterium]